MQKAAPRLEEPEADEADFKPLSAQEAQAWRARNPALPLGVVVAGQALMGVLVALVARWVTGRPEVGWSAAYGAAAVLVPAALFARGLLRQQRAAHAGSAMAGFFGWELAKLVLSMAFLAAAPRVVPGLNWLALLLGVVVVMKTYWLALLVLSRVRTTD